MDILTKQLIVALHHRRFTYGQIAHVVGVSRQRVQQIYEASAEHIGASLDSRMKYGDFRDTLKNVKHILYTRPGFDPQTIEGRTPIERIRNMVRRRDGYTCQLCFRQKRDDEKNLDVHHIDERLEGDPVSEVLPANLEPDDMITLCRKCHRQVAAARIRARFKRERRPWNTRLTTSSRETAP